jgi:hypothetical protein
MTGLQKQNDALSLPTNHHSGARRLLIIIDSSPPVPNGLLLPSVIGNFSV